MSFSKQQDLRRGLWSKEEDDILTNYVKQSGQGKWTRIAKNAGLNRCGKSCRLRWLNYLRPDIKRGDITEDEQDLIIRLHGLIGNRWALIAGRLPGRTDNEIKNYCNTKLMKKDKITIKSEEKTPETQKDTPETLASFSPISEKLREREELEAIKVIISNGDHKTDELIFFPNENNVDFLADLDAFGFSSGLVFPDLENVAGSSGSMIGWEDDAKLLDGEMEYNGDGDPILLDIELQKLASFLDLDQED